VKQKLYSLSLLFVLLFLAACSSGGGKPTLSQNLKVAYLESAAMYEELVAQESLISGNYRVWQEDFSRLLGGARDQASVMEMCYSNFNETVPGAAMAVFGVDGEEDAAEQDQAFINALAGTNFYAGNIDRCQQAALDLMDYLRVQRNSNFGLRSQVIDQIRSYDLSQRSNPKIAAIMHFYNQYSPEMSAMIERGEGFLLDQLAAENSLEPLPIDFIGFPTAALEVATSDIRFCEQYQRIYDGLDPAPGGRNPELFLTEFDPIVDSCRLYRQAAYNYMDRLFVTQQAGVQLDCGTDVGPFEQLDENCNPIEDGE
jgi:hypothetical protein